MKHYVYQEWTLAFKRSSPFLISATLSGVLFGALVISGGLTILDGIFMSGFIYSGAAQFVGLELMVSHTTMSVTLITTFLLSIRFFIYSMALIDEVKSIPIHYRVMLAFGLIDAVFVMAKQRFSEAGTQAEKNLFFLASVLIFYFNWLLGTVIGLFVGDTIAHQVSEYGLEFITYATFLAMLVPYLKEVRNLFVAVIAIFIYLLTNSVPYNLNIIISCVGAVVIVKSIDNLMKRKNRSIAIAKEVKSDE